MGCLLSFLRTGTFNFRDFFGSSAKRDQEKGASSAEKDKLLQKGGGRKNSEEEIAASKIQAGFRGYKTRKSLKSKKSKGRSDLTLTSLTPLVVPHTQDDEKNLPSSETEEESLERKRLEKVDEAIAAEIKTPLETIREESIDGSFRVKTPDASKFPLVDVVDVSSASRQTKSLDMADEILEQLSQELKHGNNNLLEGHEDDENLNVSLDDAMELEVEELMMDSPRVDGDTSETGLKMGGEEESDGDREMMEKHVIEVLNGQELGEDDPTSTSQSLGTTDVKGASLEIHESEVETMILEEDSVEKVEEKVINDNPETKTKQEDLDNPEELLPELEKDDDDIASNEADKDVVIINAASLEKSGEKVMSAEQDQQASTDLSQDMSESDALVEKNQTVSESSSPKEETPVDNEKNLEKTNDENSRKVISKSSSLHEELKDISFIDEEKVGEISEETVCMNENNPDPVEEDKTENIPDNQSDSTTTIIKQPDAVVEVEMPSLSGSSSFANNTDNSAASLSSSATTTIRPLAFHKHEDSSQDASSLSESVVPRPKPRPTKPTSVSFEETKKSSTEELVDSASKLSSQVMEEEEESSSPLPVMRRQKSAPKNRGRAVASKYRSGIVMDEEVSMEEMEAQIENDMLSQAATKIQAGFRGYKTRKNMGVSGSGNKKRAKLSDSNATAATNADNAATAAPTTPPSSSDPANATGSGFASASSADCLDDYQEKANRPPSLAYLRSRSLPGSHEKDEEGVKGGRRRGNKPTSADGAAAAVAASGSDYLPHGGASTPELEYDPAYVNNAAIKIQASVRGFLVRKHSKRGDNGRKSQKIVADATEEENNQGIPRVQFDVGDLEHGDEAFIELTNHPDLPPSSYGVGELIINPAADNRAWRDSASPASDVGSDVAATKIQAAFRGFKDRQKVRHAKKAVVTIQATVRGFLTRRRLMKLRRRSLQSRRRSSAKSMMTIPEVQRIKKANDAATKIQAVYRGYQVRSKIRKVGSDDELN